MRHTPGRSVAAMGSLLRSRAHVAQRLPGAYGDGSWSLAPLAHSTNRILARGAERSSARGLGTPYVLKCNKSRAVSAL